MTLLPENSTANRVNSSKPASPSGVFDTCVVFMLGYPGMGKRTIGGHLAALLDGVLVDNQLINRPLLELFRWDGKESIPMEIWERVAPVNGNRKLTPWRQVKTDPLVGHGSSVVAAGTRPRSRSLSR